MSNRIADNRVALLLFGLLAGLCLSAFWPHEPLRGETSDRSQNFGMMTVAVRDIAVAGVQDKQEGVFIIDYVTGRLQGAVLNSRLGTFTHFYFRDVASDFNVDPTKGVANYTFATGIAQLPAQGRITWANGLIYVAEQSSGMVYAYGFPYTDSRTKLPPVQMSRIDGFPFRQAMQNN